MEIEKHIPWSWCKDKIRELLIRNPLMGPQNLLERCVEEATDEELYYLVYDFVVNVKRYAGPNNVWISKILEMLLERPESLYLL